MDNKNDFKPYVPAEKVVPEITVVSIVLGVLLAIIFGGANAYLGLRVGMTVSASIPAESSRLSNSSSSKPSTPYITS